NHNVARFVAGQGSRCGGYQRNGVSRRWPTPRTVLQNRLGLARALAGSIPTRSRHAVRGLKPRLGVCAPLKGAPPEPSAPSQAADDSEERTVRLTRKAVTVIARHTPPPLAEGLP